MNIVNCSTLDYIPTSDENTTLFTVMCFVVRGFAATGCTASNTASFVITANAFPNNVATVFGILEMAAGLGLMIGPAIGGVLFQVGPCRGVWKGLWVDRLL